MAKYLVRFLVIIIGIQLSFTHSLNKKSELESLADKATSTAEQLGNILETDYKINQVIKLIHDQGKSLADDYGHTKHTLHQEVNNHDGEARHSLKKLEDNLSKITHELLKFENPEDFPHKSPEELRSSTKTQFKALLDEVDKIVKAPESTNKEVGEKIHRFSKIILDKLISAGQELPSKVQHLLRDHHH